eukprot:4903771-Pyramimonas_sp.AAC.1
MGRGGAMGSAALRHSGGNALCARFSNAEDPGATNASDGRQRTRPPLKLPPAERAGQGSQGHGAPAVAGQGDGLSRSRVHGVRAGGGGSAAQQAARQAAGGRRVQGFFLPWGAPSAPASHEAHRVAGAN